MQKSARKIRQACWPTTAAPGSGGAEPREETASSRRRERMLSRAPSRGALRHHGRGLWGRPADRRRHRHQSGQWRGWACGRGGRGEGTRAGSGVGLPAAGMDTEEGSSSSSSPPPATEEDERVLRSVTAHKPTRSSL